MVRIRIDYDAVNWQKKTRRCLEAGAALHGVWQPKVVALQMIAARNDWELRAEQTPDGWIVASLSSDATGIEPGESGGDAS